MPSDPPTDSDAPASNDEDSNSYQADLESVFADPETTTPTESTTPKEDTTDTDSPPPQDPSSPQSPDHPGRSQVPPESPASDQPEPSAPTANDPTPKASGATPRHAPPGDATCSAITRLQAGSTVVRRLPRYIAKKCWGRGDPQRGLSGLYYPSGAIGDDDVIFAKTPSRWRSAGPYVIAFTLSTFAFVIPVLIRYGPLIPYLNSRTPSFITLSPPPLELLLKISLVFLILAGLLAFIEALRRASTWLILTDSKLIYRNRILDTELSEIRLQDINKTETLEPFPQKLVNLGDIILYTASTDNYELKFHWLKHPQQQSDKIETTRAELTATADVDQPPG